MSFTRDMEYILRPKLPTERFFSNKVVLLGYTGGAPGFPKTKKQGERSVAMRRDSYGTATTTRF